MKKQFYITMAALALLGLSACSSGSSGKSIKSTNDLYGNYYEIFTGSFYDSDGDGKGDLKGITEKLDYLNTGKKDSTDDLKVDGVWLTPIMKSPSYHKYDVIDYYQIDPSFGNMEDFENLVKEAKDHNIRVIIDLVLNHTSSENEWFKAAKRAVLGTGSKEDEKYKDFYNFSREQKEGYASLGEGWYYEARFWEGMPDLNLKNEDVRSEIKKITDFWLKKGIAGFRLDAVGEYYTGETEKDNEFTKWFMETVQKQKKDVYVVGEVWNDAYNIESHYESGIDSLFNFPFAQAKKYGIIAETVQLGNGQKFADKLVTWDMAIKEKNKNAIDAPFLSNHDGDRSAHTFNSLEQKKMAANTYLLMPGNPFIYYGEEIGMTGSGADENKRQPMVFNNDGKGQPKPFENSTMKAETDGGSVEVQEKNPDSVLSWYKKVLRAKSNYPEIARGEITNLESDEKNIAILSYEYEDEKVAVIHNFSDKEDLTIDLPKELSKYKIKETLSAFKGEAKLENGKLTIPKYTSLILK
ncbi:hypothetical protein BG261_01150 [Floricoccus tropicus]|uniref:Glycosyl hydrolase family 13 catalytic domain-containing protein n=1 Tax=Floricoccus tropicus TaxID=1859473 RepID=A0A1E8GQK4_9LACT|nr:alpha-amylase family glycosyl hydrolase [Floricoccus tropicus]OFI50514.1 hypothetical protein BG261_01150 [Floricoccus tropicus]